MNEKSNEINSRTVRNTHANQPSNQNNYTSKQVSK